MNCRFASRFANRPEGPPRRVDALTRGMQSSFEEVLAEPIPEAWLATGWRRING